MKSKISGIIGILLLFVLLFANSEFYKVNTEKCIGCTRCVEYCPTKAITFQNGKATIDAEKCISCGICEDGNQDDYQGCPSDAIFYHEENVVEKIVKDLKYSINDKCIGCEMCVEQCPTEAITMVNDKAVIDQEKCIKCGICYDGNGDDYEGCPVEAIEKSE